MFFQHVLRGLGSITKKEAARMLRRDGLRSALLRRHPHYSLGRQQGRISHDSLDWHVNHFDEVDPKHRPLEPFRKHSPYVSLTAGAITRDATLGINVRHTALKTALDFAFLGDATVGYVFYGYVYTLGMRSVRLTEFAEDWRDILVYQDYQQYFEEGEVIAKLVVPPQHLRQVEEWTRSAGVLRRTDIIKNPAYVDPASFSIERQCI